MTDFIALIPARRASTRLPDKPLADIGGRPMIVRVAERASASGARRTIVATDDAAIADVVRSHGHEAMLTRADHASGTDRIAEVAAVLLHDGRIDARTIVVNVQGDEPLIDPRLGAQVAAALDAAPDCAIATAAHAIAARDDYLNPNVVKVVCDLRGRALYFSRAPIPWDRDHWGTSDGGSGDFKAMRHIGLYAYRTSFLSAFSTMAPAPLERLEALEQLRAMWHGYGIFVVDAVAAPATGVDTADDLARVRALVAAGAGGTLD